MTDLSIIIVNYNAEAFLRECLLSIRKHVSNKITYEVIVVDNVSSDGSVAMVREEFKDVSLIANEKNVGFSRANNQGVKKSRGRHVLFLNPDTVIQEGTLETMVNFMDRERQAGGATCYLEMPNSKLDDASHRGFPTPWNAFCHFSGLARVFPRSLFFNGYNLGWRDLDKTHEIDALAGAFMIVRRTAGEQVGWWDEDFFFYGEDLDFCYRLKGAGWKIFFVPEVRILHYKGVTGGIRKESEGLTTADKETKRRATKARFDAMRIFYEKQYKDKYPGFVRGLVLSAIAIKQRLAERSI